MCVGAQLGMLQTVLAASRLLASYDVVPDTSRTVVSTAHLLLPSGLRARFVRRRVSPH
jgi:hypothetical protein